jgi:hypothetical protein
MSLKHWRTSQPAGFLHLPNALTLLLAVGDRLLAAMCRLADARVVHYDIKCDNVLLVADASVSDSELLAELASGCTEPSFDLGTNTLVAAVASVCFALEVARVLREISP